MNLTVLFAALWVSEVWYESWRQTGRLHSKARGIVIFDRVLTEDWTC